MDPKASSATSIDGASRRGLPHGTYREGCLDDQRITLLDPDADAYDWMSLSALRRYEGAVSPVLGRAVKLLVDGELGGSERQFSAA